MTLAVVGTATCVARKARKDYVTEFFSGAWERVGSLTRPILFRWCRSEKDGSNNGGGEMIKAILKAREMRGTNYQDPWPAHGGVWRVKWWWFQRRCVHRLKIYTVICLMF